MAAPTTYTEDNFEQFLHKVAGPLAEVIGWSVHAGSYHEIVNDTLLSYGVDQITEVSGRESISRLRALGKVFLWRAVVAATAGDYDFSADGGRYSRSQIHDMAIKNLELAETEAITYDSNLWVGVFNVRHKHDPYQSIDEDQRTL